MWMNGALYATTVKWHDFRSHSFLDLFFWASRWFLSSFMMLGLEKQRHCNDAWPTSKANLRASYIRIHMRLNKRIEQRVVYDQGLLRLVLFASNLEKQKREGGQQGVNPTLQSQSFLLHWFHLIVKLPVPLKRFYRFISPKKKKKSNTIPGFVVLCINTNVLLIPH